MALTEKEYEKLLDCLFDQVLVIDRDFMIEKANRAFLAAMAVEEGDIQGTRCYEVSHNLNHPCAEANHVCPLTQVFNTGEVVTVEHAHSGKDGSTVYVEIKAFPLYDHRGNVSRVVEILRDVTANRRLERELGNTIQESEHVLEMGDQGILSLDKALRIKGANHLASDLIGFSIDTLLGMDFRRFVGAKDAGCVEDLVKRADCKNIPRTYKEVLLVTASGEEKDVELYSCPAKRSEEEMIYVYLRDITQRKGVAHKLRETNEFLTNLIESSIDGIIAADMKGTVIIFNKGAEHLLGYKAEEVIGSFHVAEFYPPGVAQDIIRRLRDEKYGGKGKILPHRIIGVAKNGEHIPISLSGALIYQESREIATVGIFNDLREILRVQDDLFESEVKFRDLFETVRHGLYFSSREGRFLDCNQALLDMLGYRSKEEFLAMDIARDLYLDPSHRQKFQKMIEAQGYVKEYEVKYKKKNGEVISVLLTAHVRKDRSGNILGYQGLFIDITERRQLEQQLFQSEKLAAMGRLTAQIAHELNNPIYGVMNCLDLLSSEIPRDSRKRRFLDMALSETERMSGLLKGMLNFFRPDEDVKTPINLNMLIEEVLLFIDKQLQGFKIRTVLDLEDPLPRTHASGNQMKQVLLNMIMNAKAAMPRGGTLAIKSYSAEEKVFLKIADTGIGIAPEIRDRIFEAFFTTKSDVKGVGLGLSVCFGIIRQHNGEIDVASEVGTGTTFTITLPIIDPLHLKS